jgi:hypothetical protein
MLRDPMDSLFDRATGALARNFATATMWSPADWDDVLRYGETARERAGRGTDRLYLTSCLLGAVWVCTGFGGFVAPFRAEGS